MALNVKINFDDCYDTETLTSDLSLTKFNTILKNLDVIPLGIQISKYSSSISNRSIQPCIWTIE